MPPHFFPPENNFPPYCCMCAKGPMKEESEYNCAKEAENWYGIRTYDPDDPWNKPPPRPCCIPLDHGRVGKVKLISNK